MYSGDDINEALFEIHNLLQIKVQRMGSNTFQIHFSNL